MGFTHYWQSEGIELSTEQTKLIKGVLKEYKDILANGAGDIGTKPIFNTKEIFLNGLDNGNDDFHETFDVKLDKVSDFEFCKTARKPYDMPVCKILCVLAISEGFNFSSDGLGIKDDALEYDENWEAALDWIESKGHDIRPKVTEYVKSRK